MHPRLPPLGTLKVFKAAAHCMSFTLAAQELNVTQAAVSHQIKSLETFLGKKLFTRKNRQLELSPHGEAYLPYIDQMFVLLQKGTEQLSDAPLREILTVTTLPSFATKWLVPRLGPFLKAHPEVALRVAPSRHLVNFTAEGIDLAIRYGSGRYPGLISTHLLDGTILPVCHPGMLQGRPALKTPADLKHCVLLHDDGYGDWRKWLLAANVQDVDAGKGPVYTDSAMAIQSAIEGDGVALARSELVKDDIARGLLAIPFTISQPSRYAYFIVYPETTRGKPGMQAFVTWLHQQADIAQRKPIQAHHAP